MIRAVIYARQSLDRSGAGAAVERQIADCRALAVSRGWEVVDVVSDNDVSASTGRQRPGYERVLGMIRAGAVDRVVVWHVDRLTRRIVDLEDVVELCERTGVRLATVTGDLDLSTDVGRMVARILAAVARGEVERKSARQKRANLQRAQRGDVGWTRRPFGYDRVDGEVIVVEQEGQALQRAAEAVLAGSTLAAAARELDAEGHTTTASRPWNVTTLRRALLNPRYAGRAVYRGEDHGRGAWPVILDAATQQRLEDVLRDPSRRVHQGTAVKYLLSGICRCGRCGAVMFASPMGQKGRRWVAYRCRACYLARRVEYVDEFVEGVLVARLSRPDAVDLFAPTSDDVHALRAEAVELRDRRDALADLLADGLLSAAKVREQTRVLADRLRAVEDRIAAAGQTSPMLALAHAEDVQAAWQRLGVRERREVVETLCSVRILPAGKGQRFDPATVEVDWRGSAGQG